MKNPDALTIEDIRRLRFQKRNTQMLRDYLAGETPRQIGKRIGMARSHVYLIIQGMLRRHYSGGAKFRLPADIVAKLKELKEPP